MSVGVTSSSWRLSLIGGLTYLLEDYCQDEMSACQNSENYRHCNGRSKFGVEVVVCVAGVRRNVAIFAGHCCGAAGL